jgi:hypothetical protein
MSPVMSDVATASRTVFFTLVSTARQREQARLLIDSLRAFGGRLRDCPFWLFEGDPVDAPCRELAGEGVSVRPLALPEMLRDYWFGGKVAACAKAEALAGEDVRSLVWLAADCLVIQPPTDLDLAPGYDVAVRPVHHRNVGLHVGAPLDPFWRGVYGALRLEDLEASVETFVEGEAIRAYYNSHLLVVNPALGLFGRWLSLFQDLVADATYQARACADTPHKIFMHQAVLSALIATAVEPERLLLLSPTYSYPYNLHGSVPVGRRAQALNDLVCIAYEERPLDPTLAEDIEIEEPLRSWLADRAAC